MADKRSAIRRPLRRFVPEGMILERPENVISSLSLSRHRAALTRRFAANTIALGRDRFDLRSAHISSNTRSLAKDNGFGLSLATMQTIT
jgi:hypothetical protein